MSGAVSAVAINVSPPAPLGVLGELALARIAADNGATRADLVRDLAPLTSHRLSPSELRAGIDGALEGLEAESCVVANAAGFVCQNLVTLPLPSGWACASCRRAGLPFAMRG